MQPTVATSYRATAVRQLACAATAARAALLRAVIVAGFRVESEQLTGIRAQRGSKLSGAGQKPDKLPMQLAVRLSDSDSAVSDSAVDACTVQIDLVDRWAGAFARTPSVAASYRLSFEAVIRDLDAALGVLDPAATFGPMDCTVPAGLPAPAAPGRAGQLVERANQALSATPGSSARGTPASGTVVLVLPEAHALLDFTDVQAMMTAGTMIATRPGAMPERLIRDITRVVGSLERAVPQAGPIPGTARIDLASTSRPALDFLRMQARMRAKLPLRTLQVCTTCRLEKVVNPDFQRLQARNRKLRVLSGTIGGAISPHGVSAFLLIGRLAQLKLLDPDFVCPRCQGMTAESTLITFCPRCGDRRTEAALRTCRGCGHDLRTEVPAESMWIDGVPDAGPAALPSGAWPPPAGPVAWAPPVPGTAVGPVGSADPDRAPGAPGAFGTFGAAGPLGVDESASHYPPAAWPSPPEHASGAPPGGWHPDPYRRHEFRWWDGTAWTDHVSDAGVASLDR